MFRRSRKQLPRTRPQRWRTTSGRYARPRCRTRPGAPTCPRCAATSPGWQSPAPLSDETRRTYLSKVRGYLTWLAVAGADGDPLTQARARDWAVRDYRTHLVTVAKSAPRTINTALAAIDDFYQPGAGQGPTLPLRPLARGSRRGRPDRRGRRAAGDQQNPGHARRVPAIPGHQHGHRPPGAVAGLRKRQPPQHLRRGLHARPSAAGPGAHDDPGRRLLPHPRLSAHAAERLGGHDPHHRIQDRFYDAHGTEVGSDQETINEVFLRTGQSFTWREYSEASTEGSGSGPGTATLPAIPATCQVVITVYSPAAS
jgi:hypothetical protein